MRKLLLLIALLPTLALACKPAPNVPPPTVAALLAASRYVIYAEVLQVTPGQTMNEATIKTIEAFKGQPITTLRSPAHSCGLRLQAGEKQVFFLDANQTGIALHYPYHLTQEQVLKALRDPVR